MFSSHNHLKRKTPCPGINREEFIQHLADEFFTSNDLEAQEQVAANLANFAYDPINWTYIKQADVLQLYLQLLESPNEQLQQYGTAGLCNICLDKDAFEFITKTENVCILHKLIQQSGNKEVILNCCTLLYQLLSLGRKQKEDIIPAKILKRIQFLNTDYKGDRRVYNLCSLLLEDFGKRYESLEKQPD